MFIRLPCRCKLCGHSNLLQLGARRNGGTTASSRFPRWWGRLFSTNPGLSFLCFLHYSRILFGRLLLCFWCFMQNGLVLMENHEFLKFFGFWNYGAATLRRRSPNDGMVREFPCDYERPCRCRTIPSVQNPMWKPYSAALLGLSYFYPPFIVVFSCFCELHCVQLLPWPTKFGLLFRQKPCDMLFCAPYIWWPKKRFFRCGLEFWSHKSCK